MDKFDFAQLIQNIHIFALSSLFGLASFLLKVRQDKIKVISLTANNYGVDLGTVTKEINKVMAEEKFPQGYGYKFGGDQKDMA